MRYKGFVDKVFVKICDHSLFTFQASYISKLLYRTTGGPCCLKLYGQSASECTHLPVAQHVGPDLPDPVSVSVL